MAFFQVRKQCLLVFFRDGLIGRGMGQTRILHLREQPVHRCTHRLCQLLYCHLCHVSLPNRSVLEVLCRMNPSSGGLFLLSEPRGAGSHNQLCCALFCHFFNIQQIVNALLGQIFHGDNALTGHHISQVLIHAVHGQ